jgi:hypothetical protein
MVDRSASTNFPAAGPVKNADSMPRTREKGETGRAFNPRVRFNNLLRNIDLVTFLRFADRSG